MYLVSLTTELCYYLVIVIQYHDKIPLVVIELIFIIILKPLESYNPYYSDKESCIIKPSLSYSYRENYKIIFLIIRIQRAV